MPSLEKIRSALARRAPQMQTPASEVRWAAVSLVLVVADQDEPEALLIRRAERVGDPWSGHVALPGGRCEPGDPDLLATARRETHEEIGLELDEDAFLGQLDDLHPTRGLRPPIVVRPFVFGLAERPPLRLNWEVAGQLWTSLDELRGERVRSRLIVAGRELEVPSIPLGDDILWGMTLRILDGFLERVG